MTKKHTTISRPTPKSLLAAVYCSAALAITSCTSVETTRTEEMKASGQLVFLKNYESRAQLDSLYKAVGVPLVILNNQILLPQVPCVDPRRQGGEREQRSLGGGTEQRQLGGETEKRNIGGDTEKRNIGGDTEKRNIGGETEKRDLGGDTEKRNIGGDTEKRNIGGETEKRNIGGETEKRDVGGDTEKRNIGGQTEKRNIGGETENRQLGGATMALQCQPLPGGLGFRILNPPATKIEAFDGITLREVVDGVVEY